MLPFTIHTKTTQDLYRRFSWEITRHSRFFSIYIIGCALLFFIYFISFYIQKSNPVYFLMSLLLPVLFLLFIYSIINFRFNSMYKKNPTIGIEQEITFTEDNITISSHRGVVHYTYDEVTKVYESKLDIYIMLGKNVGMPFEKKNCTEENIEFFRNLNKTTN